MKNAANQSYLRAINTRSVLEAIFERGPVSKAELARLLKLSKPAMADNVARLLELGVVEELGQSKNGDSAGRKPTLLRFNARHRYIITIDFYYHHSIFDLFDLNGDILNSFSVNQAPHQNFEAWITMAVNAVGLLMGSQGIGPQQLAAIGISSPGIISPDQTSIINSPMFGDFNPRELYRRLAGEFNCPVYIKNSTNASALGEWAKGAGTGARNMLYVSCGQGLGAGIILNNRLYEGRQVAAGEVGNFVSPTTLHASGTLENRICISGLLQGFSENAPAASWQALGKQPGGVVEFKELVSLWEKGDAWMQDAVEAIATELGCLVCNLVMVLNPDRVVVGGEYSAFHSTLLPRLNQMVAQHCIVPADVVPYSLGEQASGTGMATMCRNMYFDILCGTGRPAEAGKKEEASHDTTQKQAK